MIRTQIQLTEEQARVLKRLSREQKRSVAELIRQSIDLYLTSSGQSSLEQKYAKALALAGQFASGDVDLGRRHDDFLDEAFAVTGNDSA
ncbi:MAG: ribbon-helix-helix protein, CopG family [Anaerolineales bacterium]|nr:ribbon-helix-helix protein, CopG family [Anaerolineales bacterium]